MAKTNKTIKVTLVRSPIHSLKVHKACVKGLGLRRMHHQVEVLDSPENRGMIQKVSHLVKVEE